MNPGHAQTERTEASLGTSRNCGALEVRSLLQGTGGSWCPYRLISISVFMPVMPQSIAQLFPHPGIRPCLDPCFALEDSKSRVSSAQPYGTQGQSCTKKGPVL